MLVPLSMLAWSIGPELAHENYFKRVTKQDFLEMGGVTVTKREISE